MMTISAMMGLFGNKGTPTDPILAHTEATVPVSETSTTTIMMIDGIANHSMTAFIADGYTTWAYPVWTFFSFVNFTVQFSAEKYYNFYVWTGDLDAETGASMLMMKLGDTIIGNANFNSVGSGDPASFTGKSQEVLIGELRVPAGTHNLQIVNNLNTSMESENYIGIKIYPSTRTVEPLIFSFIVSSDVHAHVHDPTVHPISVNGMHSLYGDSIPILDQLVTQVNAMSPAPAFVVWAGDIADNQHALAKPCMDNLTMPYYLTEGNHDSRDTMKAQWGAQIPEWLSSQYYYYRDVNGVRLIFLDTDDGGGDFVPPIGIWGTVLPTQRAWLNATLLTDQSVFVFHHIPLHQTIGWQYVTDPEPIMDALTLSGNVIADFAGHTHIQSISEHNDVLYVENDAEQSWPLAFTKVDVYGQSIDITRVQINLTAYIVESEVGPNTYLGLGYTTYITSNGWGGWAAGLYKGVQRIYNNSGLLNAYDRPVLGHDYLGSYYVNAEVIGTTGNLSIEPVEWNPNSRISFKVNAISGTAEITLGGLDTGQGYDVYIDDVLTTTIVASGGQISFIHSTWSTHIFDVVIATIFESPDETTPPSSDRSPASSVPTTSSFTWTSPVMIAIACISIMTALVLILRRPRGSSRRRHS